MEIIQDYREVVGDNPNDITDTKYGNNNVMGPDKEKFFMELTLQNRCTLETQYWGELQTMLKF
jgi:hypothetical protein